MFQIKEAAGDRLQRSLAAIPQREKRGTCFRVVPKNDQFLTLKLTTPDPEDVIFDHDGEDVLAVPKEMRPFIKNKSLDIDKRGRLRLM